MAKRNAVKRVYRLSCFSCKKIFESESNCAPTCCREECWRKFIKEWMAGKSLPGLSQRLAGVQALK